MNKRTYIALLVLALTVAAGTQTKLATFALDPTGKTLTIKAVDANDIAAIYDIQIRPLVAKQIAEALASLKADPAYVTPLYVNNAVFASEAKLMALIPVAATVDPATVVDPNELQLAIVQSEQRTWQKMVKADKDSINYFEKTRMQYWLDQGKAYLDGIKEPNGTSNGPGYYMTRQRRSDYATANNWSGDHLGYLVSIAVRVISRLKCDNYVEIDDLVTHAWLRAARFLPAEELFKCGHIVESMMADYVYTVRTGQSRHMRRHHPIVMMSLEECFNTLKSYLADRNLMCDPAYNAQQRDDAKTLRRSCRILLTAVPYKDRVLVRQYYGIQTDPHTVTELASVYMRTHQAISGRLVRIRRDLKRACGVTDA